MPMTGKRILFCWIIFWIVSLPISVIAGEAMQLFISADEHDAVCDIPVEIKVLVLDNYGKVVKGYDGKKEVEIQVKEQGGKIPNSFSAPPQRLIFKEGEAIFSLQDAEPELLKINIRINNLKSLFPASIIFKDKASAVPQVPPVIGLSKDMPEDKEPPRIVEIKMSVQSIIEVYFSEELDDAAATDPSNYRVFCGGEYQPRAVDFQKNRVILQMDRPLEAHASMHIEIRNIKDKQGNVVASGLRSPDYEVPCCGPNS